MSKYKKEDIINERKCGLKYFDKAVELVGREKLILKAIKINKEFPNISEPEWNNFEWAFANAVMGVIKPKGDISQGYNLDEALTDQEIQFIKQTCDFSLSYIPSSCRKI